MSQLPREDAGGRRVALRLLGFTLLLLAFFLPALVNRQPVLYSDSVGYFHSGYAALKEAKALVDAHRSERPRAGAPPIRQEQNGVSTARSVYYGLPFVAAYWLGGMWAWALAQVLVALAALFLAARHAFAAPWPRMLAMLAGIVAFTGLNIFAVTAMPDLFAGLMLLGLATILAYAPKMGRWEYGFWLALVFAACLFHKGHLAILAAALAGAVCLLWRARARSILALAGVALVALAGHYAVDLAVKSVSGRWPISPPFLLARLVGDGPAVTYLREVCPTRHFATCAYLSRMPMRENDFLWSRDPAKSVMATAPRDVRAAIAAEAMTISLDTIAALPGPVMAAAIGNVTKSFLDPGVSEFGLVPTDKVAPIPMLDLALERYRQSAIARGTMPLAAISLGMRLVYFAALIAAALLLFRRRHERARVTFVLLLFWGLIVNAAVSGAISGVFDRYQGRVAWLAAFALAALWASPRASEE